MCPQMRRTMLQFNQRIGTETPKLCQHDGSPGVGRSDSAFPACLLINHRQSVQK